MPRNSIRSSIGYSLLKRRNKASYNKGFINYRNSKKFGLLYESIKGEDIFAIKNFIEKLKKDKKEIFIIRFILEYKKGRILKNSIFKTSITKKDLNFFKLPKHKIIHPFTRNQFDIVINLSQSKNIHLHYIASRCKAKLKVAPYSEDFSHIYDLMIDLEENSNPKRITESIETYLQMINKSL